MKAPDQPVEWGQIAKMSTELTYTCNMLSLCVRLRKRKQHAAYMSSANTRNPSGTEPEPYVEFWVMLNLVQHLVRVLRSLAVTHDAAEGKRVTHDFSNSLSKEIIQVRTLKSTSVKTHEIFKPYSHCSSHGGARCECSSLPSSMGISMSDLLKE